MNARDLMVFIHHYYSDKPYPLNHDHLTGAWPSASELKLQYEASLARLQMGGLLLGIEEGLGPPTRLTQADMDFMARLEALEP